MITRDVLASRLRDYLQHRITGRLGLADIREFGLTWEDCDAYLERLGYRANVDVVQAS